MDRSEARARVLLRLISLAFLGVLAYLLWTEYRRYVASFPEKFPWTELDLADPVGPFTAAKLADLADDPDRCLALLAAVDVASEFAPARAADEAACGYDDGVSLAAMPTPPRPADLVAACPAAAAYYLWQRDVIAPAAAEHLGTEIAGVTHAGAYSCRRIYGRAEGPWSAHARARAIDVTGFVTDDGASISVLRDWDGEDAPAAFLRAAREGACDLFGVTLSPDYNAAHADHFHLEMRGGASGWTACR